MTENEAVLTTVQALLGLVSPGMLGVAVELDGDVVTLHVAVESLDEETRDDVDDVVGDIEGLVWPARVEVRSNVHVGGTNGAWEGRQHRLVYLAKGQGVG